MPTAAYALVLVAAMFEPPPNIKLIAAMPDGTESIIVTRDADMRADGSSMHFMVKAMNQASGYVLRGKEAELRSVVAKAISDAVPVATALGGSDFTWPSRLGSGGYTERQVWCVEHSLAPLSARLAEMQAAGGSVSKVLVEGQDVYRGLSTDNDFKSSRDFFAAIVDDHTLLAAETIEDISSLIRAWNSKGEPKVPERWKAAASTVDLNSPIVVLRAYGAPSDRDACNPNHPKRWGEGGGGVKAIAVTLPVIAEPKFKFVCLTADADRAVAAWKKLLGPDNLGSIREDFEGGFKTTMPLGNGASDPKEQEATRYFHLMMLFGVNFAI